MTKGKITFRKVYLIYLAALLVLMLLAVGYVRAVLKDYERRQPERQVEQAMAELSADAEAGTLWEKYALPEVAVPGRFEENVDVKAAYLALWSGEDLGYTQSSAPHAADELLYTIHSAGFPLAEVVLGTAGEPVTKLGILTSQAWEIRSLTPVFTSHDLTLSVPADFSVTVNGTALTEADGTVDSRSMVTYAIPGVYVKPRLTIQDASGQTAQYTFRGDRVLPELYNYTLTLPAALTVQVDGARMEGQTQENGMVRYDVVRLNKPEVRISDRYGNTVDYEGGDELPLTYLTLSALDQTVRLGDTVLSPDRQSVPEEYAAFADYVPDLPQVAVYQIAVLQENAEITVTEAGGGTTALEPGRHTYDLTGLGQGQESVPAEIAGEVDVLDAAQKWSLFMSNDLRFTVLAPYLIKDSYQYNMAYKYAHSIDITFTSNHTLKNPTFTDISVTNFVPIADNCFSVDISFVKHMLLGNGLDVDDAINDRFYFVKYDDTADGKDNPAWKIAGMKEVVNHAG